MRDADAYCKWLGSVVDGKPIPSTDRARASVSCLGIAQDHHQAIVVLLSVGVYASCFALLRVEFEAYVRGEWLAHCATEAQVEAFLGGEEPPKLKGLLCALEQREDFGNGHLSAVKQSYWNAMCGYTHTGGIHVQRWNTDEGIHPAYDPAELLEVLRFAEGVSTLAAMGILSVANDVEGRERLLSRYRSRVAT